MVTVIYTEEAKQWIFLSIYCRVYWLHMTSKHMRGEKREREKKKKQIQHTGHYCRALGPSG